MKKPIIKNWIKYWTTTIAVSGMLALGACDNNGNQTADNIETTTEETVTSTRENVNQGMEEASTAMEEGVSDTEQAANMEATEENAATNQPQYDRTANTNTSSERSATAIRDMDSHLEEHEDANEAIKEELTDANLSQQNNTMNQQGSTMDQQGTTGTQQGTNMNQQGTTDTQQGTNMNQQGTTDTQQSQDQSVGYDTDRQGTTEMNIQENQGTQNPTQQQNSLDNQQQDTFNNQEGNTGIQQRTFDQQDNQGINQQSETETNQQGTTGMDQQNTTGMDQQGTTGMDQQNATGMDQNTTTEDPAMIYERHIMIYGEDLDEENRQRMEDIGREYSERRESMRGQMDQETGAYVSPEVDPQPRQGYDQVMNQIQENIEYPQDAVAAEMEGTVYVNFILDENGNITEAQAYEDVIVPASNLESATTPLNPNTFSEQEIEELRKEMRKEAVRAVKETSGMWEPGMQDGQAVKTEVQLPVQFEIEQLGAGTDR